MNKVGRYTRTLLYLITYSQKGTDSQNPLSTDPLCTLARTNNLNILVYLYMINPIFWKHYVGEFFEAASLKQLSVNARLTLHTRTCNYLINTLSNFITQSMHFALGGMFAANTCAQSLARQNHIMAGEEWYWSKFIVSAWATE